MKAERDAMMMVRAELCGRLANLQSLNGSPSARSFAENVDGLRRLAAAYGLDAVVRLASALERSLFERDDFRTGATALYLQRLDDAIGCGRVDDRATEAMVASVAVRFV